MNMRGISPGNKIDLRILQNRDKEDGNGTKITTYISSVYDISEDGTFELNMPVQSGKILLLPLNSRYEFIFTTTQGLYKGEGVVIERYRKNNFYLMKAKLTTELSKFQRREYYRMDCYLPLLYLSLMDEVGEMETLKDVQEALKGNEFPEISRGLGTILDISGGGLRFITEQDIGEVNFVFLHFEIQVGNEKRKIELIAKILGRENKKDIGKFMYRAKFLFKDTRYQEQIIRFIFEEERRRRQNK